MQTRNSTSFKLSTNSRRATSCRADKHLGNLLKDVITQSQQLKQNTQTLLDFSLNTRTSLPRNLRCFKRKVWDGHFLHLWRRFWWPNWPQHRLNWLYVNKVSWWRSDAHFLFQPVFENKSSFKSCWIKSDVILPAVCWGVLTSHTPPITHSAYLQQDKAWALITKKTATQQWKQSPEDRNLSV